MSKNKDVIKGWSRESKRMCFPAVEALQGHLWPRNARLNCWLLLFSHYPSKKFWKGGFWCCLLYIFSLSTQSYDRIYWFTVQVRNFFTLFEQMKHSVKSLSLFFIFCKICWPLRSNIHYKCKDISFSFTKCPKILMLFFL